MNDELKNKLIAALIAKGLGKEVADLITITDESEIEGVVAKASSVLKPSEKTKEEKLADKEVQAEIDRRVTSALAKAKDPEKKTEDTPPANDTPEWAKALIEQNKALTEKVNAIESGKVTETKQQQALSLLQKSEILNDTVKEKWASRINVNSEVSIEDQVKGLETEFSELRQGLVDSTPLSGSVPIQTVNGKASDAEIEGIVANYKL